MKKCVCRGISPKSIKEKGTYLLNRAANTLHHKAKEGGVLEGTWMNGMDFTCKLNSPLMANA
eukprot:1161345-Pelagomonas_calceolata.AAC.13